MTPIINIFSIKIPFHGNLFIADYFIPLKVLWNKTCRHKTINGLQKRSPKKTNQEPCTICYTENMTTFHKGKTVYKTNLQPGELIHMEFALYNTTPIRGFTSMLTVVCEKTRIIWVFTTEYKIPPVQIIHLILTTLKNKQQPCRNVRVNKEIALEKSIDVTKILVDDFRIYMENNCGDASCINGKNEPHNIRINSMVISVLLDSNQH